MIWKSCQQQSVAQLVKFVGGRCYSASTCCVSESCRILQSLIPVCPMHACINQVSTEANAISKPHNDAHEVTLQLGWMETVTKLTIHLYGYISLCPQSMTLAKCMKHVHVHKLFFFLALNLPPLMIQNSLISHMGKNFNRTDLFPAYTVNYSKPLVYNDQKYCLKKLHANINTITI